ncbi:fimbrial biogenesis chaperone [Rosenbergiella epipactidis]|uniref:fimbrial biogenesis chaperone n=1 Tax=Rosenbergiella epipactidis TaxID=1544694 RepID=UPI001F4FF0D1|nr:fimbria/pilus periplasmic chaperone [Rosenbergiella epipactidis]
MKLIKKLSLLISLLCISAFGYAGNVLLVWPILQVIEADQQGSALWLENRGNSEVHLQARILSWQQRNAEDHYADQSDVVASPPFVVIPPKQKQLIRLIRTAPAPAVGENAYRIILDQLPPTDGDTAKESAGLHLQMRYVLPLFTYAQGIWTKPRTDKPRDSASATVPNLTWRITTRQGQRYLAIRNSGIVHSRLTQVFFATKPILDNSAVVVNKGLLGYVLAGQSMDFPLTPSSAAIAGDHLYAKLDDNGPIITVSE